MFANHSAHGNLRQPITLQRDCLNIFCASPHGSQWRRHSLFGSPEKAKPWCCHRIWIPQLSEMKGKTWPVGPHWNGLMTYDETGQVVCHECIHENGDNNYDLLHHLYDFLFGGEVRYVDSRTYCHRFRFLDQSHRSNAYYMEKNLGVFLKLLPVLYKRTLNKRRLLEHFLENTIWYLNLEHRLIEDDGSINYGPSIDYVLRMVWRRVWDVYERKFFREAFHEDLAPALLRAEAYWLFTRTVMNKPCLAVEQTSDPYTIARLDKYMEWLRYALRPRECRHPDSQDCLCPINKYAMWKKANPVASLKSIAAQHLPFAKFMQVRTWQQNGDLPVDLAAMDLDRLFVCEPPDFSMQRFDIDLPFLSPLWMLNAEYVDRLFHDLSNFPFYSSTEQVMFAYRKLYENEKPVPPVENFPYHKHLKPIERLFKPRRVAKIIN